MTERLLLTQSYKIKAFPDRILVLLDCVDVTVTRISVWLSSSPDVFLYFCQFALTVIHQYTPE